MSLKTKKIFICGHNGMVGNSLLKLLKAKKFKNIIVKNRKDLDLTDFDKLNKFITKTKPHIIINCAGLVGGIMANNLNPLNFLRVNINIQLNIINSCEKNKIKNFINLGSSCIYPKFSKQPIKEDYLLTGKLEPTNDAYAIAKIAGIKMCESYNHQFNRNFICLMPTNLYGPNDNYDLKKSHFFPALIKKIHLAKKNKKKFIEVWGNGKARRELMYVDDLANACEFFLKKKKLKHSLINIGSGEEKSIKQFCFYIMKKLNYNLKLKFDHSKPNGTPRKFLDCKLALKYGWKSKFSLDQGFKITYKNFTDKKIT